MNEAQALIYLEIRRIKNSIRYGFVEKPLKLLFIAVVSFVLWYGLFLLFNYGINFFRNRLPEFIGVQLINTVLYVFFLALLVMLSISSAIILFSSIYRSREFSFLNGMPLSLDKLFVLKLFEAVIFSSWAAVFLSTPLLVAYGNVMKATPEFYAMSLAITTLFVFLPSLLGAIASMVVAPLLPKSGRGVVLAFLVGFLILILFILLRNIKMSSIMNADVAKVVEVFEQLGFAKNPFLPSSWAAIGILASASGDHYKALMMSFVILSLTMFLLAACMNVAPLILPAGLNRTAYVQRRKTFRISGVFYGFVEKCAALFDSSLAIVVVKDVKSFLRDVTQWSQFAVFTGLLAVYFFNIRALGYDNTIPEFRNLVAQMNLFACCLTIATFSSRFVFPLFSLEGKRLWIIGMGSLPMEKLLFGKFLLSALSLTMVSEILVFVSDSMLRISYHVILIHLATVLFISVGLSALAVGLGVLFADLKEENPAKIVAGYGGLLNLIINLIYVTMIFIVAAVPTTIQETISYWNNRDYSFVIGAVLMLQTILASLAILIPLGLANRRLRTIDY